MRTLKSKLYTVRFADAVLIVEAVTKAGALKLAANHFRKTADVNIAAPIDIYSAGGASQPIITAKENAA